MVFFLRLAPPPPSTGEFTHSIPVSRSNCKEEDEPHESLAFFFFQLKSPNKFVLKHPVDSTRTGEEHEIMKNLVFFFKTKPVPIFF